jgi:hypothetical protein
VGTEGKKMGKRRVQIKASLLCSKPKNSESRPRPSHVIYVKQALQLEIATESEGTKE